MFWRQLRSSLIAKATLVIGILFLIAVVRVIFVAGLNWMERHDDPALQATTIMRSTFNELTLNLAGAPVDTARGTLVARLQVRLQDEELRLALSRPGREALRGKWLRLNREWTTELAPALERGDLPRFLRGAGSFSRELDSLGSGLQAEHQRLKTLDLHQVIMTMLLVISVQLLAIYALRCKVARPFRRLLETTEKLRQGRLDERVDYCANDEIGRLALGLNSMADALQASHRALEERVEKKVKQLAQANAALQLLSRSSHRLALGMAIPPDFGALLQRFQEVMPGLRLDMHLGAPPAPDAIAAEWADCHRFSISSQGQRLGELCALFGDDRSPAGWESDLVRALADLIGSTVMLERQREHNNQILLLNERSTIARELHDSLAQSLSFMKLQIARLQVMIHEEKDCEAVATVAEELRTGINDAYAQLRQLLTTFRLDIGSGELRDVLEAAVRELGRRSNLDIRLQADALAMRLSPEEEAHLVQVMREALTNCVRHADAMHVEVRLRQAGDEVELVVEDDGRGFMTSAAAQPRHGIAIMRERAASIGGTLNIESRSPRGTRLCLRFRPAQGAHTAEDATE